MTKEIPLSQGKVTIVDDCDYDSLIQYRWHAHKDPKGCFYAVNNYWLPAQKKYKRRIMHRLIMNAQVGQEVDHINGDGLDNRRVNLRLATRTENNRNCSKRKNNTSGFKGVFRISTSNGWFASIRVDKKTIYLGSFSKPEEAAIAYDSAAVKYFGEFARLNFPKPNVLSK